MVASTPAHIRANKKYDQKTYERIGILVKKKDNKREQWKAEASRRGKSLNGFLYGCVEYVIENDIDLG